MFPTRRSTWIALGVVLALGVAVAAPSQAQPAASITLESRAQLLYQQGRERFAAGEFEQARAAFQSSLDTVDSPNTRMYLGRTLLRLGRDADAWAMLDRAARDADARAPTEPRYVPTRDAARTEADAIAPSLAWLTLDAPDAPEGLQVRVNGTALHRGGLGVTTPMAPGEVVIDASAPGHRDAHEALTLVAGQRELRSLTLEALPRPPREVAPPGARVTPPPILPPPDRTGLRVGAIVTTAALAAVGATALVFWASSDEARAALDAGRGDEALRQTGAREQDVARGLGVASAALFAGSLLLHYFAWRPVPARPAPLTLHVGPAGVGGTF